MKHLMTAVALLALTSGAALADNNEIHVFQLGADNDMFNQQDGQGMALGTDLSPVGQIGIGNELETRQVGFAPLGGGEDHVLGDGAEFSGQIGAGNSATIEQFGQRHTINRFLQVGIGNTMSILQENEDQTLTTLEQRGLGNAMTVVQRDANQTGLAEQFGLGNTLDIEQDGDGNSFDILQGVFDEGLPAFGASVTATQSGVGNALEVRQAGGPNHVVVTNQVGVGLIAVHHQGYTPAP